MTTEQLQIEISKVKALGCKLSDAQITAIVLKKEAKELSNKKTSDKRWAKREESNKIQSEMVVEGSASDWLAAKNRENAIKSRK